MWTTHYIVSGKKKPHLEASEAPLTVKPISFMIPAGMTLERISPLFDKKEETNVRKKNPKMIQKEGKKKQDGLEKEKGVRTSKSHREL